MVEARHVLAAALGLALVALPLYILSFDPESRLDRLRTPLCRGGLAVAITNQNGGDELIVPESGVKMYADVDGEPYPVVFRIFHRMPGEGWEFRWELGAPQGREVYFVSPVKPGMSLHVRAVDPTGERCPEDSPALRAAEP